LPEPSTEFDSTDDDTPLSAVATAAWSMKYRYPLRVVFSMQIDVVRFVVVASAAMYPLYDSSVVPGH
jgi:hypothetical protein